MPTYDLTIFRGVCEIRADATLKATLSEQELCRRALAHDALVAACRRSLELLTARLDMAEILDEEKRHRDELLHALAAATGEEGL